MYHAFPPLIHKTPQILILGTFPSPISREREEYYGNSKNKFWNIIFDTFEVEFDNTSYEEKKELIFKNNIAVWDVIKSCEIVGALDQNIKNPIYNKALPEFINKNKIAKIIFNGKKAYEFYQRGIGKINGLILPSTSPANARLNYDKKLSAWSKALRNVF